MCENTYEKYMMEYQKTLNKNKITIEQAIKRLKHLTFEPTIDEEDEEALDMAIEALNLDVVRCKDCKYHDPEDKKCDCGHDIYWQLPRPDEWFCADGEGR